MHAYYKENVFEAVGEPLSLLSDQLNKDANFFNLGIYLAHAHLMAVTESLSPESLKWQPVSANYENLPIECKSKHLEFMDANRRETVFFNRTDYDVAITAAFTLWHNYAVNNVLDFNYCSTPLFARSDSRKYKFWAGLMKSQKHSFVFDATPFCIDLLRNNCFLINFSTFDVQFIVFFGEARLLIPCSCSTDFSADTKNWRVNILVPQFFKQDNVLLKKAINMFVLFLNQYVEHAPQYVGSQLAFCSNMLVRWTPEDFHSVADYHLIDLTKESVATFSQHQQLAKLIQEAIPLNYGAPGFHHLRLRFSDMQQVLSKYLYYIVAALAFFSKSNTVLISQRFLINVNDLKESNLQKVIPLDWFSSSDTNRILHLNFTEGASCDFAEKVIGVQIYGRRGFFMESPIDIFSGYRLSEPELDHIVEVFFVDKATDWKLLRFSPWVFPFSSELFLFFDQPTIILNKVAPIQGAHYLDYRKQLERFKPFESLSDVFDLFEKYGPRLIEKVRLDGELHIFRISLNCTHPWRKKNINNDRHQPMPVQKIEKKVFFWCFVGKRKNLRDVQLKNCGLYDRPLAGIHIALNALQSSN